MKIFSKSGIEKKEKRMLNVEGKSGIGKEKEKKGKGKERKREEKRKKGKKEKRKRKKEKKEMASPLLLKKLNEQECRNEAIKQC